MNFDLIGTVLNVVNAGREPPDTNFYKFFTILMIVLMLLPFVIIYVIFKIAWRIFFGFLGFRSGSSLFGHFFWIMVGRDHGGQSDVPVQNVIIETPSGNRVNVRIKGYLIRGSINPGDLCGLNGRWEGGTYCFILAKIFLRIVCSNLNRTNGK